MVGPRPVAGRAPALMTFPTVEEGKVPLVFALNQGLATWILVAKAGSPAPIAESWAARLSPERKWGLLTKAMELDCYTSKSCATRTLLKNSNTLNVL